MRFRFLVSLAFTLLALGCDGDNDPTPQPTGGGAGGVSGSAGSSGAGGSSGGAGEAGQGGGSGESGAAGEAGKAAEPEKTAQVSQALSPVCNPSPQTKYTGSWGLGGHTNTCNAAGKTLKLRGGADVIPNEAGGCKCRTYHNGVYGTHCGVSTNPGAFSVQWTCTTN